MGLVVKDEDFLRGLEIAMRQSVVFEEFIGNLKKQEPFFRLFANWAMGDAKLVSEEEDDKFKEEYGKFFKGLAQEILVP